MTTGKIRSVFVDVSVMKGVQSPHSAQVLVLFISLKMSPRFDARPAKTAWLCVDAKGRSQVSDLCYGIPTRQSSGAAL